MYPDLPVDPKFQFTSREEFSAWISENEERKEIVDIGWSDMIIVHDGTLDVPDEADVIE